MKNRQQISKVIGIPGYKNPGDSFFGAGENHLEFISKFGNPRIIMPWEEKVDVDLLYLPGGLDTSPANYDEVPSFLTTNQDVMKEFFYRRRLKNYVNDTPIFGVCLGMQMLGVYFGSKLTQNLICHPQSPERWATAHEITIINNDANEEDEIKIDVNSHHHQCILSSNLADSLEMVGYEDCFEPFTKKDDVIVEIFKHTKLPIVGVQYHPEELYDSYSLKTINKLLSGEPV